MAAKPGTQKLEKVRIQAAYLALISALPKGGGRAQGSCYSLSAPLPCFCSLLALSSEGIAGGKHQPAGMQSVIKMQDVSVQLP